MSGLAIVFIGACTFLFLCLVIFRYEERQSKRFGGKFRAYADAAVLQMFNQIDRMLHIFGRDSFRQAVHYIFHTLLRTLLKVMKRIEKTLQQIIQVNKGIAKNIERESATQTMLEKVALHKAESALTEKEKRVHKEKSLNGS